MDHNFWRAESMRPLMLPLVSRHRARSTGREVGAGTLASAAKAELVQRLRAATQPMIRVFMSTPF